MEPSKTLLAPSKGSSPPSSNLRSKKRRLERTQGDPDISGSVTPIDFMPETPTKPRKRGKVESNSIKRRRVKTAAEAAAAGSIPSLLVVPPGTPVKPISRHDPWGLDERSQSAPMTPSRNCVDSDILGRITPRDRTPSLEGLTDAPSKSHSATRSSMHSQCSPFQIVSSPVDESPEITGLCQKVVRRWVVDTNEEDLEMIENFDHSPAQSGEGKGATSGHHEDQEMLFDGEGEEPAMNTLCSPPGFPPSYKKHLEEVPFKPLGHNSTSTRKSKAVTVGLREASNTIPSRLYGRLGRNTTNVQSAGFLSLDAILGPVSKTAVDTDLVDFLNEIFGPASKAAMDADHVGCKKDEASTELAVAANHKAGEFRITDDDEIMLF
ncbi:hypothetical protein FN846DRAFT_926168 [Sphaerosporella brunnea]|uniref:Uncharacterized protein n=1 Tax=Sphaerosporella brunnea TaxID=1250544 RepID=A0A5J5FC99_9PEZI|nr:hypothetical protein FN846DRAFT_926168 [Sphaerosporella brunnea]